MKRSTWTWATVAALAAGAGCGNDEEFADALPSESAVKIAVPQSGKAGASSAGEEGLGRSDHALLGAPSEFYQATYATAVSINGGTLALLGTLHLLARSTPTTRTADGRTWGPWTPGGLEPLTYRASMKRIAPGRYTFSIDGRPRAAMAESDFLPLIDGMVDRGALAGTGKGTMSVHFDHLRKLRPDACEQGTIAFAFDNTGPSASLDVTFHRFGNGNPMNLLCRRESPRDAAYHYDRAADGSGNFTFTVDDNVHKPIDNKPKLESLSIRSRWLASGAGRADLIIGGGEVATDLAALGAPEKAVTASQCWDASFRTVYETGAPAPLKLFLTAGDPQQCAFANTQLPR